MEEAFDAFMSDGFQSLLANSLSDFGDMDAATLQAVVESNESTAIPLLRPGNSRGNGLLGKRELDEADSDEDGGDEPKKKQKNSRSDGTTKAEREKARRERINRLFLDLGKLVSGGTETFQEKSANEKDKTAILADAIRFIQHMTCENHQLKQASHQLLPSPPSLTHNSPHILLQVNKFLEEKVGSYERERSYYLYQQAQGSSGPGAHPPWVSFPPPSADAAGPSSTNGALPNPFRFHPPPPPSPMIPSTSTSQPHVPHHHNGLKIGIPSIEDPTHGSHAPLTSGGLNSARASPFSVSRRNNPQLSPNPELSQALEASEPDRPPAA